MRLGSVGVAAAAGAVLNGFNEAEAHAPRMAWRALPDSWIARASMRPRRMRYARIEQPSPAAPLAVLVDLNEAEAHAPRIGPPCNALHSGHIVEFSSGRPRADGAGKFCPPSFTMSKSPGFQRITPFRAGPAFARNEATRKLPAEP